LGVHDGKPLFEQAAGLHDPVTGLSVVDHFASGDPEVIFEEHGIGHECAYFALHPNAFLGESVGPRIDRPDLRAQVHDEDLRSAWVAIQALFTQEDPRHVNQAIRDLRAEVVPGGGAVAIVEVSRRCCDAPRSSGCFTPHKPNLSGRLPPSPADRIPSNITPVALTCSPPTCTSRSCCWPRHSPAALSPPVACQRSPRPFCS
jgi:hypothetical protein